MDIIADRLKGMPTYLFMRLRNKIKQIEATGADCISLAIGDPVEPTPAYIIDTLREAVLDPDNHQYPTDEQKGMLAFRKAVARWYHRKYAVTLEPETEVLTLGGSKEGIHHFMMAAINPGDTILITNPGYPGYRANILLAGGRAHEVPLLGKNGFLPQLEEIPEDVCRRAKAFFLNYPNNPTGACADSRFFTRLVAWARRHNILLVHDNPYSELVFPGSERLSLLQIPGAKDISVEFNSLSKYYNMTGWRIGMAVGNRSIIQAMCKFKENVTSGVFNAIQLASIKAMDEGDADIDNMLAVYRRRREMVLKACERMRISTNAGMGTFYLWLQVPNGLSSIAFAEKLLDDVCVLVTAGTAYGQYGEGYFRLSLTVPDARLQEALHRMQESIG
ncbi:MAG: LL-diaminopimelate aminotransferase [Deltaproteobacteria bacterium SG8_13]|nr:MAG: LL-diaminopimelate aminotransferase [Deltaproteobacteria bacterium SG8_13]